MRRATPLVLLMLLALIAPHPNLRSDPAYAAVSLGQVKIVSFVAATTTSLKLSWPKVKNAKSYELELADNYEMAGRASTKVPAASSRRARFVISGLTPGKTYCVQVRAKSGKSYGTRSKRTCKPTIALRGAASGSPYRVMTYNVCAQACKGDPDAASWRKRSALARSLIMGQSPDIVALQEHPHSVGKLLTTKLSTTYAATTYVSAKDLLYKKSRFSLPSGRTGSIELGPTKYAVWAELEDKKTNQRVIFVSVHLTDGKSSADDTARRNETINLVSGVAQINTRDVPVVFAGDFNSNKSRQTDAPAEVFRGHGFYDSYDLASRLKRPNWNSAADFSSAPGKPRKSPKWGDHVDRVFVRAASSYVSGWVSPAEMKNSKKYASPMPSDHKPVVVSVWVNRQS